MELLAETKIMMALTMAYGFAKAPRHRNLTRIVFHQALARDDRPNFVQLMMTYLAVEAKPTGDIEYLDI